MTSGRPIERVLLANPPTGLYIREDRCQSPANALSASLRAPIDLAYMAAAVLEAGAEARIRDYPAAGLTEDALRDDLLRFRPEVLVLSTISPTLDWDLACAAFARQVAPEVQIVLKGSHVALKSHEILAEHPAVDVVIRGEFEEVLGELVSGRPVETITGLAYRDSDGVARSTPDRPYIEDPDRLPFPARHLLDNALYQRPDTARPQTTLQAAWGCPGRCIYCLAPRVSGRTLRSRSPDSVVAEIRHCVETLGITDFYFRADTFTLDRPWVRALCERLIAEDLQVSWGCNSRVDTADEDLFRLMRRAGCWIVGFGVESGSDEMLQRIKKGATVAQARAAIAACRRAGLRAYAFFMIGFPWETEETAAATLELSRTIGADFIEMNIPVPFPGTELASLVESEGLAEAPLLGHDHSRSVFRTHALTRERVDRLWRRGLLGFYLRPRQALRLMRRVRSPGEAWRYLRWGTQFVWRLARSESAR